MTPYGIVDLGQHWFRWWLAAWGHQAITWTTVDKSSVRFCSIHLSTISQELPQKSIFYMNGKIDSSRLQGAVSIRKTVLPGMAIPMLKIRRPNGRLIFNMENAIRR